MALLSLKKNIKIAKIQKLILNLTKTIPKKNLV